MEFEWDDAKAEANRQKRVVTSAEASNGFADALAALFPDPDHSDDELREILVGYTERGDAVRIISARPASPGERRRHEQRS